MHNWIAPMLGIRAKINFWEGGAIKHGDLVAIDTETLLIDDDRPWLYPDVAVLTAYSGGDTVDLVEWGFIPAYINTLIEQKKQLVFHNAPFDMGVLGLRKFVPHIDKGLIWDTGLQWTLRRISTDGMSDKQREYPSLARVVRDLFKEDLDKDSSIRLTFVPGMKIDKAHAIYACGDAIATWKAATIMGPQNTLDIQVKGFVTLDLISRAGFLVDMDYMEQTRLIHEDIMNKAAKQLLSWGIKTQKDPETGEIWEWMVDELELPLSRYASAQKMPIAQVRNFLHKALQSTGIEDVVEYLSSDIFQTDRANPATLLEYAGDALTKKQAYSMLWRVLDNLNNERAATEGLQDHWEAHQGWPVGYSQKSAQAIMTDLLAEAEKAKGIRFPRTKTGQISVSEDALMEIPDSYIDAVPFLSPWKEYKHSENMISTYLEPKLVRIDGRVHTRFCPIMASGRTSSRGPNLQNLPKEERLRGHYIADRGYVICSCDYGQQELVTLAQNCYSRYGISRMREVINLGIDIHGYVGSRIHGIFKDFPEFTVDDRDIVDMYIEAILDFKQTDPDKYGHFRQLSKALNFGLPGGLGPGTFVTYAKGYGVTLRLEESKHLCALWKDTFPEMEYHLSPTPMDDVPDRYVAETLTGRKRVNCSFCAAANTLFQGFAADISKSAGWELAKEGFGLIGFVHDEYLSLIPWDEHCTARAFHMQKIMEDTMQAMTPDVKCKAEPAIMFRWTTAAELWLDGEGDLIPYEYVPTNSEGKQLNWEDLSSKEQTDLINLKHSSWEEAAKERKTT